MKLFIVFFIFVKVIYGLVKFVWLLFSYFLIRGEGYDFCVMMESVEVDVCIYFIKISFLCLLYVFLKVVCGFKYYWWVMEIKNDFDFEYLFFNDGVIGFWLVYCLWNIVIKVIVMVNDDKYLMIGEN